MRLSRTLGANVSDGFKVEMGADEWAAAYAAVAERLGGCAPGRPGASPGAAAGALRLAGPARMSRRAALRRGALRVALGPLSRRTRVSLVATSRASGRLVRVASRRVTLAPGGRRSVSVPLTRRGRALLRSRRSLPVTLSATAGGERARRVVRLRG